MQVLSVQIIWNLWKEDIQALIVKAITNKRTRFVAVVALLPLAKSPARLGYMNPFAVSDDGDISQLRVNIDHIFETFFDGASVAAAISIEVVAVVTIRRIILRVAKSCQCHENSVPRKFSVTSTLFGKSFCGSRNHVSVAKIQCHDNCVLRQSIRNIILRITTPFQCHRSWGDHSVDHEHTIRNIILLVTTPCQRHDNSIRNFILRGTKKQFRGSFV